MKKSLLHTPEGVRDIYNAECTKKKVIVDRMRSVIDLYGYNGIETPTFEFFDIFDSEKGSVETKELFKFFDRDGNILVLRPDMTPSIARCAVKYYTEEDMPLRLSYVGNTFINNLNYQGRLKETTQIGAELIGDDSVAADAEIIAIVINIMLKSGISEFQVDIGQVDYFKGLIAEAELDSTTAENLRKLIQEKNYFGVEELLDSSNCNDSVKNVFLRLPQLFGSYEILDEARALAGNEISRNAVERLIELSRCLDEYGLLKYISFDFGMLSRYEYYTGIIFNAYTYGTGDSIIKGGRYDKLLAQFGTDVASVGFAVTVDQMLVAMSRQKINIDTDDNIKAIVYSKKYEKTAIKLATNMRNNGQKVRFMQLDAKRDLTYYIKYCKNCKIAELIEVKSDNQVNITDINTANAILKNIDELEGK